MSRGKIGSNFKMSIGIYIICFAIIMGFAMSNFYVLQVAGNVANAVQRDAETDLVRKEIELQITGFADEQSELTYWDDTVEALYGNQIDMDFVDYEIAEWSYDALGTEHVFVIDAAGEVAVTIFEDQILSPSDGTAYVQANFDLVEEAWAKYFTVRKARGDGFATFGDPIYSETPLFAGDFRMIEGQLGLLVVQAVIPDDSASLPDGNPMLVASFRSTPKDYFGFVGDQLGLTEFYLTLASDVPAGYEQLSVGGIDGSEIVAVWRVSKPAQTIWDQTFTAMLIFLGLVAFGLIMIAILFGRNVSKMQQSEARNRFLAQHDALTGLPNRLQFDTALEQIIAEGELDRCAILCMDLDKFKAVNDTYGHQAGDAVIKTVANRVSDLVGDRGLAARVGGDEFIIVLRKELDRDNVLLLCDSIIEHVCEDIIFDNGRAAIGASIGVAWWPDDALTAKTVIRSADEALYRAKENGRGQTCQAMPAKSLMKKPA